jgi:hypothetical protein
VVWSPAWTGGRGEGGVCAPSARAKGNTGHAVAFLSDRGKRGRRGAEVARRAGEKGGKRGGGGGRLGHATRRRMGPGPTGGRHLAGITRARWPRAGGVACPDRGQQGSKGGVHGQRLENMGRPRKKGNGPGLRENSVGLKNIQMV